MLFFIPQIYKINKENAIVNLHGRGNHTAAVVYGMTQTMITLRYYLALEASIVSAEATKTICSPNQKVPRSLQRANFCGNSKPSHEKCLHAYAARISPFKNVAIVIHSDSTGKSVQLRV